MKKFTLVLITLLMTFVLAACGASDAVVSEAEPVSESEAAEDMSEDNAEESADADEAMDEEQADDEEMEASTTIVDLAVADGRFNTLVAAVVAADLAETLSSEGEFTVFAPTDDAFAALPEGTVESLLEDPDGALTDVLLYHVVDGAVPAETVVTIDSATTLNGEDVSITTTDDGQVMLNDSVMVTVTDIEASNGIIHVIDGVLVPSSVADAADESAPSIAEIAAQDGRFNTLVAAVTEAGLAETLSGEGEFTVFAPTDDAFAALPEGTVNALLADPEGALTDVLLYHVVDGAVPAETVVTLDSATTLNGEAVNVSVVDGEVFLNDDVQVVITDIEASNGIIHVIDGVLVPSSVADAADESAPSIAEIAAQDGRFNTLVAAVTEAGLAETLSSEGEFTVFAPTDDAFAALPEGTVDALLADPEGALTDVLLYHVVDGAVPAETVITLDSATTLNGEDVSVSVVDGEVFLNDDIQVLITDIQASNGIIHVIDGVLVPQSVAEASDDDMMADESMLSIAEIAAQDGRFNTLVAAVTEAGLAETLSGEGEFTVFAPTDDAFAALPEGAVDALLADPEGALTDVLLYHVVDGAVPAETVITLDSATTLNGEDVSVSVVDGEVFLNDDIQVLITDIQASNGIIHVIDGVLVPQSVAQASADEDMATVMAEQTKMQSQYKMQSPDGKQSCSPRA